MAIAEKDCMFHHHDLVYAAPTYNPAHNSGFNPALVEEKGLQREMEASKFALAIKFSGTVAP